jgi:hypothetical protein
MSFGIPVRNGLGIGLLPSTAISTLRIGGRPALMLNFISSTTLDSRITFTRASTASFVGSNGLIQTAAIDAPRFDYDPVTLAAKGLLIEEQRTNFVKYSDQFGNALGWSFFNATVNANVAVSPDGSTNGDAIVENTTNGNHGVQQFISYTSGTAYTLSFYVKAGTRSWCGMTLPSAAFTGGPSSYYNLSGAGTLGTAAGSPTARSITAVGNGWYRITITATATATAGGNTLIRSASADNTGFYVGVNGAEAIYLYGAQLEAGAFSTSYIPTVTIAVLRSPDIATMTGTNFSSWYNASAGTFLASYEASPNLFATYLAASNGTVGANSFHFDNDSGGQMRAVYYSGSVAQATLNLGAYGTAGTVNTVASAYAVNDFAASRNGGAVVTDTSGALPVGQTQLNIGADPSGAAVNVTNTHIRSIAYYNTRLANTTLQALTV